MWKFYLWWLKLDLENMPQIVSKKLWTSYWTYCRWAMAFLSIMTNMLMENNSHAHIIKLEWIKNSQNNRKCWYISTCVFFKMFLQRATERFFSLRCRSRVVEGGGASEASIWNRASWTLEPARNRSSKSNKQSVKHGTLWKALMSSAQFFGRFIYWAFPCCVWVTEFPVKLSYWVIVESTVIGREHAKLCLLTVQLHTF